MGRFVPRDTGFYLFDAEGVVQLKADTCNLNLLKNRQKLERCENQVFIIARNLI